MKNKILDTLIAILQLSYDMDKLAYGTWSDIYSKEKGQRP